MTVHNARITGNKPNLVQSQSRSSARFERMLENGTEARDRLELYRNL